jgi:protein-tyrosine kinase
MTSLIEKAAQRLEQLRQAGAEIAPADSTGRKTSDVPRQTSVTPVEASRSRVVRIDLAALAAEGYVTPNAPRSAIADQFRVIKRPLLANATGKGPTVVPNGNLIMVTSAMPGEGKSFTAINLAMSLAMELDHRVLLVDADVAKPSLLKKLGLPAGSGLLDLLLNSKIEMSDVMLRTNIDKLSLLPSGTPHAHSTELLASDAMTALIEQMGRRYSDRIIIFDSPPLLLTTQARVLAVHMGQVVVVVQAEATLQSAVQHALSTIEACPVKLMVLNQARRGGNDAYGYGYGYGQETVPVEAPAVAAS